LIVPGLFTTFVLLVSKAAPERRCFAFTITTILCASVPLFVQHMTPHSWVSGARSSHDYLITQPYVALLYFKTFFWPNGLSSDYDLKPIVTIWDTRLWIGFAFIVFISAAAIIAAVSKKTRLIGFGLLWFLVALLPTSLFPLAEVI